MSFFAYSKNFGMTIKLFPGGRKENNALLKTNDEYRCCSCNSIMEIKGGENKKLHFFHNDKERKNSKEYQECIFNNNESGNKNGINETIIHKIAKEMLCEMFIELPEVSANNIELKNDLNGYRINIYGKSDVNKNNLSLNSQEELKVEKKIVKIIKAEKEKLITGSKYRADLFTTMICRNRIIGNDEYINFYIEIIVNSGIKEDKREFIRGNKHNCLSIKINPRYFIDVNKMSLDDIKEKIKECIDDKSNFEYVYYDKLEEKEKLLEEKYHFLYNKVINHNINERLNDLNKKLTSFSIKINKALCPCCKSNIKLHSKECNITKEYNKNDYMKTERIIIENYIESNMINSLIIKELTSEFRIKISKEDLSFDYDDDEKKAKSKIIIHTQNSLYKGLTIKKGCLNITKNYDDIFCFLKFENNEIIILNDKDYINIIKEKINLEKQIIFNDIKNEILLRENYIKLKNEIFYLKNKDFYLINEPCDICNNIKCQEDDCFSYFKNNHNKIITENIELEYLDKVNAIKEWYNDKNKNNENFIKICKEYKIKQNDDIYINLYNNLKTKHYNWNEVNIRDELFELKRESLILTKYNQYKENNKYKKLGLIKYYKNTYNLFYQKGIFYFIEKIDKRVINDKNSNNNNLKLNYENQSIHIDAIKTGNLITLTDYGILKLNNRRKEIKEKLLKNHEITKHLNYMKSIKIDDFIFLKGTLGKKIDKYIKKYKVIKILKDKEYFLVTVIDENKNSSNIIFFLKVNILPNKMKEIMTFLENTNNIKIDFRWRDADGIQKKEDGEDYIQIYSTR